MHIQFLGGASGVGATCQLLSIGQRRVLVDAGVRVDAADRLPDLAALDSIVLDAILITHAHADHIGALPLVAARNPGTPIYASPATICLLEVMLGDAVRVMARRAAEELELPLYDDTLVAATLRMLRPLQSGAQRLPELPGVDIAAQRAGHIAGAVSLGFDADDGRLVISGDVSVTPQRTILGAAIPEPRHPDLLILESTYGARLHPNRAQEERRLVEAVAEVVERGGHCLLPSFALGRAQEIISILRAAQRDGVIPPFPIAVDGLVRRVCAAYTAIPEALTPGLRRYIQSGGRPFFGGSVQAIDTPKQRDRVLAGPPGAIIASSGMLTGGPSVWYAERIASDSQSAVLFSGYLDEEAPGRRLLDLADTPASDRRIKFGERTLPVACQLGRYNLSAHADGDELAGLVRALKPRAVALVHGDPEARAALGAKLRDLAEVSIPQDGQTLTIAPGPRGGRRVQSSALPRAVDMSAIGAGMPLDEPGLERLWTALRDGSGVQTLGGRELTRAWYGDGAGDDELAQVAALLEQATLYFRALPGAPGLYRLLAPTEVRRAQAAQITGGAPSQGSRIDQMSLQAMIDHYLRDAPDLYQRSIDPATGAITLRYFFPDVARARDAQAIQALADEAGVSVNVSPQPHQGQLAAAAIAALPANVTPARSPAIRVDARTVELRCMGQTDAAAVAAAQRAFAAQTGWRLVISGLEVSASTAADRALPGAPLSSGPDTFDPPKGTPRTEVNWALQTARVWFGPDTGCYKIGADQANGVLTMRFHFPDSARARHAAQLAALAAELGWTVRIWPQVHQAALMQAAREALPAGLVPLSAPAIQSATRDVVVRVRGATTAADRLAAATTFQQATGWQLVLRGDADSALSALSVPPDSRLR